jgi:hypothetical protein
VPSLANRQGNFSDQANLFGNCGNGPCTVNGPYLAKLLTQRLGYTVSQGEPFYTGSCGTYAHCVFPGAVIPQSVWSTPAQKLLQYIPLPNVGTSNFSSASNAERINDDKGSARVDAYTRFGNLSAYYFLDNYNLNNPYPGQQGGATIPGFNALSNGRSQLVSLGDTATFGPSMVNEFRVSYMRNMNDLGNPQGGLGVGLADQGFAPASASGLIPLAPQHQGVMPVIFNS